MIYAKTGMERMPENCRECEKRFALGRWAHCLEIDDLFKANITDDSTRLPDCPLTEIDETLPAQLAAAEARCAKFGRLLDESE